MARGLCLRLNQLGFEALGCDLHLRPSVLVFVPCSAASCSNISVRSAATGSNHGCLRLFELPHHPCNACKTRCRLCRYPWPEFNGHVPPKSATCAKKAAVPKGPEADDPCVARRLIPRLFSRRDQQGLSLGYLGDVGALGRCQHPQHRVRRVSTPVRIKDTEACTCNKAKSSRSGTQSK